MAQEPNFFREKFLSFDLSSQDKELPPETAGACDTSKPAHPLLPKRSSSVLHSLSFPQAIGGLASTRMSSPEEVQQLARDYLPDYFEARMTAVAKSHAYGAIESSLTDFLCKEALPQIAQGYIQYIDTLLSYAGNDFILHEAAAWKAYRHTYRKLEELFHRQRYYIDPKKSRIQPASQKRII